VLAGGACERRKAKARLRAIPHAELQQALKKYNRLVEPANK